MQVTSKNIGLLPDGRYTIETNLQVRVTKSKASFIFRYQFAGRRRDLSLGSHPTVTVTAAKQEAAKCRALLARGIDPLDVRAEHRAEHARRALDFASYAEHALETIFELKHLSEATKVSWRGPMKNHILPVLRHKLVADITVQDICEVLDPLWEKKTRIASRIRGQLEAIFTLAKREGVYIGENPATWKGNLEAYFPPPARVHRREHQKAYTIEALADQLKASLRVDRPVHNAFVFGVLTATRQAEFNDAKWSEIDFEHKVWTVPPERRKDASPSHSASHCLTKRSRCSSALRQRASTSFRAATTTIAQWLATMSRQWCSTPLAARQQCMAAGLHFATGARAKASTPQWQKSALCTRSSQCRPHIRETTCLSADDPSCSNGQMRSCR